MKCVPLAILVCPFPWATEVLPAGGDHGVCDSAHHIHEQAVNDGALLALRGVVLGLSGHLP